MRVCTKGIHVTLFALVSLAAWQARYDVTDWPPLGPPPHHRFESDHRRRGKAREPHHRIPQPPRSPRWLAELVAIPWAHLHQSDLMRTFDLIVGGVSG